MFSSKEIVETVRKRYPVGCRVRLVKMDDVQAPPIGTLGTVYDVDDTGSSLVNWDDGSGLNVVYGEDTIDIQEGANSKCICGSDFMDVWFITNLNDVDSDDLGTDYPIVEVNPEDDIKYVLEESGAYDEEIERMTENGTYEEFVRKVKEHIDWNNLQGRMIQAENEAISAAIDAIINKG